ncbi:11126_t:CDS:2, partial [Dentiscutata erythropus]
VEKNENLPMFLNGRKQEMVEPRGKRNNGNVKMAIRRECGYMVEFVSTLESQSKLIGTLDIPILSPGFENLNNEKVPDPICE